MLSSLHISHYILIDSLDIEFPEGLVIVTGQTGAGKSILLGALSLVSGAKADATQISQGADSCVVEAEFDGADEAVHAILDENEVEWDGGHLTIRRVVHASGRSRSFVNDCPVNVAVLQQIADHLIDIHSQHKSILLTDRAFQLSILDSFAGNDGRLQECKAAWSALQASRSELAKLRERLGRAMADADYNSAQYKQLEQAALREGELEALEEEQKGLANAEQIKDALNAAQNLFDPAEMLGIDASLKEIRRQLEHVGRFMPAALELAERLESSRIEIADISAEVEDMNEKVDLSPEHLAEVEDRMSLLYSLLKKHGCMNVSELIGIRDRLGEELYDSSAMEEKLAELEARITSEHKAYSAAADALSEARRKAAPGFAASILESLRFLELDRAQFELSLESAADSASGRDKVCFLFSSNGTAPVDVAKCASGGEISRIMLSLKAMMARFVGMPTLIFDEIDTGVSGSVADRMGSMICSMGEDMQVFSITHLPQVAAKGHAHYVVSKSVSEDGRTLSSIHKIDGQERINEIARLLSGAVISDAALANARELLDAGQHVRGK